MTSTNSPPQNQILAALSRRVYKRLRPDLELVHISVGDEIHDSDIPVSHLYFPLDCIVACVAGLADGGSLLTALTGNEGMVGISYLLGCEKATARAVALSGGSAMRIKPSILKKEFDSEDELQCLLLRFTHARIIQKAHIAIGARFDSIEQQLCGFLLMMLDRLSGGRLYITQEQVSIMLGVRRESITIIIQRLAETGMITARRGHLTVVNRQELELRAGESYSMSKKEFY